MMRTIRKISSPVALFVAIIALSFCALYFVSAAAVIRGGNKYRNHKQNNDDSSRHQVQEEEHHEQQQQEEAVVVRRKTMMNVGNGGTLDCVLNADDTLSCSHSFTASSMDELDTYVDKVTKCVNTPDDAPPPFVEEEEPVQKIPVVESESGSHDGNQLFEMSCPRRVPTSLTRCGGWMPPGAIKGTCNYYFDSDSSTVNVNQTTTTTCDCINTNEKDEDNRRKIYWDCGDIDPKDLEEFNNSFDVVFVDVVPNAGLPERPTNTGTILPNLRENNENCPDVVPVNGPYPKFSDANTCDSNLRTCGYHNEENGGLIIHCRCDNYLRFYCAFADSSVYYDPSTVNYDNDPEP